MQTYTTPSRSRISGRALLWLVVFAIGFPLFSSAQLGSLVVSGNLRHEDNKNKLTDVTVTVLQNGEAFDQIEVDRNGKYYLDLPLRHDYMLVFDSDGMVPKRVQINCAHTPEDMLVDGFMFDLDMSLFDEVEGFDLSIMDTPIGIATFEERNERIQFDLTHTNDMRRLIDNELDRLANLEEDMERARMRYENAMDDGERAEARERWDDAAEEYEKALKFMPGDAEAQAGLDRAKAQLDAARRAEAEEELAAQKERERAQQAEADRQAQEAEAEAESRREAEQAEREAALRKQSEEEAKRRQQELDEAASASSKADNKENEAVASEGKQERSTQADVREQQVQARAEEQAAQQQALLNQEEEARAARQREWEERQAAREAERQARNAQAQARAQSMSNRSSKAEDEAEAYYRKALESERQAAAAEVQDLKEDVEMQKERWNAEARDRARDARRQATDVSFGTPRGGSGREVGKPYAGREAEHRRERAATWDDIQSQQRAQANLQAQSAARQGVRAQSTMLDLDMAEANSNQRTPQLALSAEDRDIPQGVQETSYDIQNGLVIMRTVRNGDVIQRYRKVVMKTGTYYFCGDRSITKTRWELETNLTFD